MIGEDNPSNAHHTDFKGAIRIGLDECMTALEEALTGLTDEQAWNFPLPNRHNITTIGMHCIESLHHYALHVQTGESLLSYEERFDMWGHSPEELRALQKALPTVSEAVGKLRELREAVLAGLEVASEVDLLGRRTDSEWYVEWDRTGADAYLRTIMHTMAHVRQIWMLRGVMGLTDEQGWPLQHWA